MGRGRRTITATTDTSALRGAAATPGAVAIPEGFAITSETADGIDFVYQSRVFTVRGQTVYARQGDHERSLGTFGIDGPREAMTAWHRAQNPGLHAADFFDQPLRDMLVEHADQQHPSRATLGQVMDGSRTTDPFERAQVLEEQDFGKAIARRLVGPDGQRYVLSSSRMVNETLVAVDHGGPLGESGSRGLTLYEAGGTDAQAVWRSFLALPVTQEVETSFATSWDDDDDDGYTSIGEAAVSGLRARLATHEAGVASEATVEGLREQGLVDETGALTALGARVQTADLSEELRDYCVQDSRYDDEAHELMMAVGYVDRSHGELSELGLTIAREHGWARKSHACSWCGSHGCDLDCNSPDDE